MSDVEVKALFPTPLMCVTKVLPADVVSACVAHLESSATETQVNFKSEQLRHTELADPANSGPYARIPDLVAPYLSRFGELLFGESLKWHIKEMWTNRLEHGGFQAVHTHSNSFVSGIVYLTSTATTSRTLFHRSLGGREFLFSNDNERAQIGPFNGDKWLSPPAAPGDMVLFPSYVLHEVPRNEGSTRMSVAFNAIPERLDNWGYAVRFNTD